MRHYNIRWRPFAVLALVAVVLTACVEPLDPGQKTPTGDDASDKMPFKVTQTSVNDNGRGTKTVSLRYYEDMPHVAYIAVSDFQNLLVPGKSIKMSKTAASQYTLETIKGETAKVNTAEGFCYQLSSARARLVNKAGENIDSGVVPHIALEVKKATGQDDDGDEVAYSDFSAFYAPSVGEQIVNWYAQRATEH